MKLVPKQNMTDAEARHAVPPDEAARFFQRSLDNHESIEGLAELRQGLPTSFNADVIDLLKTGEWQMIDDAAYRFDWGQYGGKLDEEKNLTGHGALLQEAKIIVGQAISPFASVRKEPILRRKIVHGLEGALETGYGGITGIIECSHHIHTEAMVVQLTD